MDMNDFHYREIVEKIAVQRTKNLKDAILVEINEIIEGNETLKIVSLNEKAIVNAIEKAIQTKPIKPWDSMTGSYYCPVCCSSVEPDDGYCRDCGKKLDWSAEYE